MSTTPPKRRKALSIWRFPSATDDAHTFVATSARGRRESSACASTRSALPYIGEESNRPAPCARARPTTSCAFCSAAGPRTSKVRHVPNPITGTAMPVTPSGRLSTSTPKNDVLWAACDLDLQSQDGGSHATVIGALTNYGCDRPGGGAGLDIGSSAHCGCCGVRHSPRRAAADARRDAGRQDEIRPRMSREGHDGKGPRHYPHARRGYVVSGIACDRQ